MTFQLYQFSFIVFLAILLVGCEPGFYEQRLNHKIEDHLERIRFLNESIEEAESAMQGTRPLVLNPQRTNSPDNPFSFRFEERKDFLLLQKQCQVDNKWLESHLAKNGEELLEAIETNDESEVITLACLRFPADRFQFTKAVSNLSRHFFVKPSTAENRDRPNQRISGAFGYPLEQLFNPPSVTFIPEGNISRIKAAFDPDQKVLQLDIFCSSFTNPALQKNPLQNQSNSSSSELFSMTSPDPKSPSTNSHTVRLATSRWALTSALPVSNNPNRVALHFIKAIEVN